ncbi:sigma-70 family RNA polymerase sigma factor [Niabella terrae]
MPKVRYQDITDSELLQRYLKGRDNQWLGVLLERYTLLLLGLCMKYLKNETEARDAVQQIFLKVIQELPKYRVDYFKSWLYMVGRNYCLTLLRDRKGKIPVPFAEESVQSPVPEPAGSDSRVDLLENGLLEAALKNLNPEQHECVTLFYLKKMSYQQVSQSTGYSLLQVKSYIQNGKRNMKLYLEKKLKDQEPGHVG